MTVTTSNEAYSYYGELDLSPGNTELSGNTAALLDEYQQAANGLIKYDPPSRPLQGVASLTIRGQKPADYFQRGLVEELGETVEVDTTGYNRLQALMRTAAESSTDDDAARAAHVKEFGDVMWYVANLADEHGLRLSDIVEMSIRQRTAQTETLDAGQWALRMEVEAKLSWMRFLWNGARTAEASEIAIRERTPRSREAFAVAAGQMIITMAQLSDRLFDVNFGQVLFGNYCKIVDRHKRNTVLKAAQDRPDRD